jgi:hypothetical protein
MEEEARRMTRPICIDVPHKLSQAEARARIDKGFAQLEQEISAGIATTERRWDGDRMSFTALALGQTISGRLEVQPDVVKIEIDLPQFLGMIADTVKGRLKKRATLLLEKK